MPALVYLSSIYMEDHRYADTVPLLEKAASKAPENHGVQMTLGVAYRGVGRYDDAQKAYRKALALDPADPDPHLNLGILFGDYLKDYDKALASYNDYLSSGGKESELVEEYVKRTEREKKRAAKLADRERKRKEREAEAKRQAELAEQFEKEQKDKPDEGGGETPPEQPEEQPQPEEGGTESPWGDGGGQ